MRAKRFKTKDIGFVLMGQGGQTIETVPVVADCHRECQQFPQCLLRVIKPDDNLAGIQLNAGWQIRKLLIHHGNRGFHEHRRPVEPGSAHAIDDGAHSLSPAPLILGLVPGRQLTQSGDDPVPIRQSVDADSIRDAGSNDLLRPPLADAEQEFDGRPIHEGARLALQFGDDFIQSG
jgi:hypothetical protein